MTFLIHFFQLLVFEAWGFFEAFQMLRRIFGVYRNYSPSNRQNGFGFYLKETMAFNKLTQNSSSNYYTSLLVEFQSLEIFPVSQQHVPYTIKLQVAHKFVLSICSEPNILTDLIKTNFRSSRPKVFSENGVLKNFAKLTGKYLRRNLFFN